MTMMMMQRLLQNNNNNNNGYADETRLNGIRHHSASPFSKPTALQTAGTVAAADEPDALQLLQSSAAANDLLQQQQSTAAAVQTGTCATVVAVAAAEADDRLTSDEDDELNVDEDPVDLTNNRLHGSGQLQLLQLQDGGSGKQAGCIAAAAATASATAVPMDTTAGDYETSGGGAPCNKQGGLAFSVENILDPNKFTKKLIAPAAILPRWRPRVDFSADPSVAGKQLIIRF